MIDVEARKLKKKLDEAHLKMKMKQENYSEESKKLYGNFFKTHLSSETIQNDFLMNDKIAFQKRRTLQNKTQLNFNYSKSPSSYFESDQIKLFVDKLKIDNDYNLKNMNFKDIQNMVNSSPRETIDKESINFVTEMKENEKKLIAIQTYLSDIKKMELKRINFEFVKKDYQRRFNITHEEIVSIIVGEDNTSSEISKLRREEKKLYEQMKKTLTFNFNEGTTNKFKHTNMSSTYYPQL